VPSANVTCPPGSIECTSHAIRTNSQRLCAQTPQPQTIKMTATGAGTKLLFFLRKLLAHVVAAISVRSRHCAWRTRESNGTAGFDDDDNDNDKNNENDNGNNDYNDNDDGNDNDNIVNMSA
jgi:hypothetical protein